MRLVKHIINMHFRIQPGSLCEWFVVVNFKRSSRKSCSMWQHEQSKVPSVRVGLCSYCRRFMLQRSEIWSVECQRQFTAILTCIHRYKVKVSFKSSCSRQWIKCRPWLFEVFWKFNKNLLQCDIGLFVFFTSEQMLLDISLLRYIRYPISLVCFEAFEIALALHLFVIVIYTVTGDVQRTASDVFLMFHKKIDLQ